MAESVSWKRFSTEVMRLYQAPSRRPATRAKINQALREMGRHCTQTGDIDPATIADWLARHPERSPWTRRSLLGAFRAACKYGVWKGWIDDPFQFRRFNSWIPADELDEADDEFPRHRTAAEVTAVLALADLEAQDGRWETARLRAVVYTAAFTGAGNREIMGLRVRDVDLAERVIRFRSHSRRRLKTGARGALAGINGLLYPILEGWIPLAGGEWLYPNNSRTGPWLHGGPGRKPLDQLKALGKRAKVEGLTFLSLRHTVGTLAEAMGLGELELQAQLRHSRRKTQKSYRGTDLELRRRTAAKIDYRPLA